MGKTGRGIVKKIFLLGIAAIFVLAVAFVGAIFYFSQDTPTFDRIANRQVAQSTKIYDRTGEVLLYEISAGEKRTVIPLEEIPAFLKDATIAVEDEGFYEESAIDWRGILRALWVNIRHGRVLQGGSTITQQLAKNVFLSPEQTVARKIKELILAIRLDRYYTKDQILGFYLNEIPYGPTAYGVEAASQTFFGKSAKDLNLGESAILAALPKAPSYYLPWGSHTNELFARQKFILNKMREIGKIDDAELEFALKTEIVFAPQGQGIQAPHFVIAVQEYLVQKYGEELVRTGGLKITTTLDPKLQELAERVVREGAEENKKNYQGYNAALVAEDPKTGEILAMVGSRDYFASSSEPDGCESGISCKFEPNFNVATQGKRQPGSAMKPFAYLVAFKKGYTPETVVFDVPTEFVPNNPNCPLTPNFEDENPACFHPENFDEKFRGPVNLRSGLAQSINIPSVKVLYLAGLDDMLRTVASFGITTLKDPSRYGLSLVLGGGEVKLVELVGAYAVLAQDGVRRVSATVREVRDSSGRVLEAHTVEGEVAYDPESVRLVNDVLSDVTARAGLFSGSLPLTVFEDHDVALKTGTSNDYRDAWALGYTPSLVVGVWAGNNDNSPMQRQGSSILAAIPIWHAFMAEALKSYPTEAFSRPDPPSPAKPILRGDYLASGQIHSILHYVQKDDPEGPQPVNPAADPQYNNWEAPVLEWARSNLSVFGQLPFGSGATSSPLGAPQVRIRNPQSGAFMGGRVDVFADISALSGLAKVRIYLNGALLQELNAAGQTSQQFNWSFMPQVVQLQNLLVVEAVDKGNRSGRAEVILFR